MTLKDYLDSEGISAADFARRCGVSRCTIWQLLKDPKRKRFSVEKAYMIQLATEYKVKLKDMVDPLVSRNIRAKIDI